MKRRTFITGLCASVGLAAGSGLYTHDIERHNIDIQTIRLNFGLERPLKIVALGDVHFDPLYELEYIKRVSELVARSNADLVVYLGDLFSHDALRADELASLLSIPKPTFGCFAVLGNHDFWSNASSVQKALEKHNIRVLRNSTFAIPGFDALYLTGLESYWAGKPDPLVVSNTPLQSKHILLVHEPDPFGKLNDQRIKLQISGHTHGGQIRVPLFGALRLPSWGRNYEQGLFQKDQRFLYVNRGIGTLRPYLRFNCRPEITEFVLS